MFLRTQPETIRHIVSLTHLHHWNTIFASKCVSVCRFSHCHRSGRRAGRHCARRRWL